MGVTSMTAVVGLIFGVMVPEMTASVLQMSFRKLDGDGRAGDQGGILAESRIEAPSIIKCALECMNDATCNGYNFHREQKLCEILTYSMNLHLCLSQDAQGWQLYLPTGCPTSVVRPTLTGETVSMLLHGVLLLNDIYCHNDGAAIEAYLNLQTDNYAFSSNQNPERGSDFTKYGLDLSTLTIRNTDFTFATIRSGYTAFNNIGYVDNCSHSVQAIWNFNLTGTSFKFTDDMCNHWGGYHSWIAADQLLPQSSYLAVSGACSSGEIRNGDGNGIISLQLIS